MPDNDLIVEEREQAIELRFNRPDHGNGITPAMWQRLYEVVSHPVNKPLLIRGVGADFSTGRAPGPKPTNEEEAHNALDIVGRANQALKDWPLPTIAMISGRAFGAALGLILHCDIAIADGAAQFSFPEVKHGIAPTIVAAYLGDRVGHRRAVDILLTGRQFGSHDAYDMGIVHYVVDSDELTSKVDQYLSDLSELNAEALARTKRGLLELPQMPAKSRMQEGINRVVAWQLRSK